MRLFSTLPLLAFSISCVEEPSDITEPDCTADTNCIDPEPEPEPEPEPTTALSFSGPVSVGEVGSLSSQRVTHGDVDGDGNLDLVHGYLDSLVWLKGDGQGGFSDEEADWTTEVLPEFVDALVDAGGIAVSDEPGVSYLHELILADFDGDGRDDLLVAFSILDENGDYWSAVGTVDLNADSLNVQLLDFDADYVSVEVVADLDSDGGAEILIYTFEGCFLSHNGGAPELLSTTFAGNYYPQSWTMDVDHDGILDLVSFYNGGFGVTEMLAYIGTGSGEFEEKRVDMLDFGHTAAGNGGPHSPASEIVVAANDVLYWIEHGEEPVMHDAGDFFEGLFVWSAVFGDFTGSGDLDVLARNSEENLAFSGDGEGDFAAIDVEGLQLAGDEVAADFTNDGLDDFYRVRWNGEFEATMLELVLNTSR